MTWHRYLAVGAFSISACAAPLESFSASEGHGALAGTLSITVVEEGSGVRLQGAIVRVYAADGAFIGEGTTRGDGTLEVMSAALTGTLSVDVSSGTTAQRIEGLRSAEVVLALPAAAASSPRVRGTVTGLPTASEASTQVGVGLRVTLLRTQSLAGVAPSTCVPTEAGSCTFEVALARGTSFPSVATVSDASGAIAFVFGQISESSATLNEPLPPTDLSLRLPSDNAGLVGVIGVPGLALHGQLILLPQAQSSAAMLRVPSVSEHPTLFGATYWVLVEGHPMLGSELDMGARSVLFQRGLGPTASAAWDAWLDIPSPLVVGNRVSFEAISGAHVYAVDFIDSEGALLGSTWVLEGAGSIEVTRPERIEEARVSRIRVRAIDTVLAPTGEGFDSNAIELGAQRFSERDWLR